jgi:hypothetical protein
MNDNIITLPNGDFKRGNMENKQVEINGNLIPFNIMKNDFVMTEVKEINLIGYSKIYFINGQRYESTKPLKFYK